MSNLLEITGDDIVLLNDTDLRSLIGLLCEADFRLAGLPTTGITWGGHQDASDDGVDVTVQSEWDPPQNSYVPRKTTEFQVKKPDMPRSKILKEMRPKNELRERIKSLIQQNGAYIIVSSNGYTTDAALRNRIKAMNDAVTNEPDYQKLHLDFLDRGRIATWVRTHPSLILWVRNKIGKQIQGWQSYSNWSNPSAGLQEEYIIDEELRLYNDLSSENGESIIDGLHKLRLRLSQNGTSVRLTGLSGVGKTRLVQALFDERVGEHVLNQTLAYYTDISDNPTPDPPLFANQLIATKTRAITIIDNCSLELHRNLTKLCAGSMVSLLTVEYDIRDDLPEETDVFRLEPASDDVIEKLLTKRFPYLSQINARIITEFASGNARVAIALANTLKRNESLSTLKDEDLFTRLFWQRHDPNDSLRISAEICSLVYSFNGEDTNSSTTELKFLAALAEKSPRELYRDVAELKKRGLVQARNRWRAVLPHAIANRLAKNALNSIPTQIVVDAFLSSDSERLIKSFTHRLGYLHDCESAIEIANAWLKLDGWLGATNCNLNSFGLTVFKNIAPIAPEAALTMLEHATNDIEGLARIHSREYIRLLIHLAYDADLFERSVRLLSQLALVEDTQTNNSDSACRMLPTLFHILRSGTHAPMQARAMIIDGLINSNLREEQELGINLLEAALETNYFRPSHVGTFGARPRDFGSHPNTNQEIVDWYKIYLALCTRTALINAPIAIKAKRVLANRLEGLWSIAARFDQELFEDLERSIIEIHRQKTWNEGWVSIRKIIRFNSKGMEPESLIRLQQLSQLLRPVNLLERARTYVLTDEYLDFDLEYDIDEDENDIVQWQMVQDKTREIGKAVAQDEAVFIVLLPELVSNSYDRLGIFGEGLGEGCHDRNSMWQMLYKQIERTPTEKRRIEVMLGFLSSCAKYDSSFYHSILDSLIEDKLLGQWFPYFQMTSDLDDKGIERLHKVLDEGDSYIYGFERLAWGRRHEAITDDALALLLRKLSTREGGIEIVILILSMRFYRAKGETKIYSQILIAVSREILLQYDYAEELNRRNPPDYKLAQIADIALQGEVGVNTTLMLCQNLAEGIQAHRIYSFHFPRLLDKVAEIQPEIFLDSFIGKDDFTFRRLRFDDLERVDSPVNQIPNKIIVDWCKREPEPRFPLIVPSMQMYLKSKDSEELYWHPILNTIFEEAPNLRAVLLQLEYEIDPKSWSGSRADAMAKRFSLFEQLLDHSNPEIRDWAIEQNQKLYSRVQKERERELRENQERFERFE